MAWKAIKVYDDYPDGFTETVDYKILCCGNIEGNNNKFYAIEIQKNPDSGEHRIFTHYGRINTSNVWDYRGPMSLAEAQKEFDKIVNKKLKGKNVKDPDGTMRREKYELVDTPSPTVGSPNIRGKTVQNVRSKDSARAIVEHSKSKFTPDIQRLLLQFAQENIHQITTMTSISVTANGLETALGPVTEEHVDKARGALTEIQKHLVNGVADPSNKDVRLANNLYYSLIPHDFGRKITQTDWILDDSKLIQEFDILDQLAAAVQLGLNDQSDVSDQFNKLDTEIQLASPAIMAEMNKLVEGTKKHTHLGRWRVKNVYEIKINKERERFDKIGQKIGNVKEYFHGSQNKNLLSISIGGLIIPPHNAGHVTGRMFGDGIYGASSSTKSLNYSVGGWSGQSNKFNNAFLLRVKFAMGKTYEPNSSMYGGAPSGYNSVSAWARKTGLLNDEFIVYSLPQCTITHLIELEER